MREPLGAYLWRAGAKNHLGLGQVLRELGIASSGTVLERITLAVSDRERDAIIEVFGLTRREVADMTLDHFAHGDIRQLREQTPALQVTPVCAQCVRVGVWDLLWYTGLLSVCATHRVQLLRRCTACGEPITIDGVRRNGLSIDDRFVHGRADHSCSLRGASGRPAVGFVHASETASNLLGTVDKPGDDMYAIDVLRVLVASRHSRHVGSASDKRTAVDEHHMSDLQAAVAVATGDFADAVTHPEVGRIARESVRRHRGPLPIPSAPTALVKGEDRVTSVFWRAAAMYRATRVGVTVPGPGFAGNIDMLPTTVPLSLFELDLADAFDDIDLDVARTFTAVAIAQPAGSHSWSPAGTALRLGPNTVQRARTAIEEIEAAGRGEPFWDAAQLIRQQLAAAQINFATRVNRVLNPNHLDRGYIREAASTFDCTAVDVRRWLLDRWAGMSARYVSTNELRRVRVQPRSFDELDASLTGTTAWTRQLDELLLGRADAADRSA